MAIKKEAPKKKSTSIVKWSEKLAALAKETVQTEVGTGGESNFIKTKSGVMSYQGATVQGNKMAVIVLDHVLENAYRPGKYEPDNPKSPVCYAFGRDAESMAPKDDVPNKQAERCDGCPKNEFGSAETGKGMACGSNRRRLALIPATALAEGIAAAEVAYLSLPYFSGKEWKGYVRDLEESMHLPPLGVVTEIAIVPDAKSQFRIKFTLVEEVAEKHFELLWAKHETAKKHIDFPYIQFEETAPVAPAKKGPAKKNKY